MFAFTIVATSLPSSGSLKLKITKIKIYLSSYFSLQLLLKTQQQLNINLKIIIFLIYPGLWTKPVARYNKTSKDIYTVPIVLNTKQNQLKGIKAICKAKNFFRIVLCIIVLNDELSRFLGLLQCKKLPRINSKTKSVYNKGNSPVQKYYFWFYGSSANGYGEKGIKIISDVHKKRRKRNK